jgi:NAD(P)-dependent dehydrogenase (short-subunit alcohol dehydrogenase family)
MVQSALGQRLHLAGLILSSSCPYPTGPIETITPDTWNDVLQTSILGPISLIQSFLPLVYPRSILTQLRTQPSSKIIFLTPSIIPSLHPPFNAPATITHTAISSLALTLSRELPTIPVHQIKLGTFDLTKSALPPSPPATTAEGEIASWPSQLRGLYDKAYQNVADKAKEKVRGGNVRELHNAVFDVLALEKTSWWRGESRVWGVGSGVGVYGFIGRCVPEV